jgi:hypothetical protein
VHNEYGKNMLFRIDEVNKQWRRTELVTEKKKPCEFDLKLYLYYIAMVNELLQVTEVIW